MYYDAGVEPYQKAVAAIFASTLCLSLVDYRFPKSGIEQKGS
jgi:hypothetical protein